MDIPPDIQPGQTITASWLNAIKNAVARLIVGGHGINVNSTGGRITVSLAGDPGGRSQKRIFARITGVAAMAGRTTRWIYDIELVNIIVTASSGTPTAITIETTTDPATTGKAINLAEIANDDDGIAFAVNTAGASYPNNFAPRPISGGGTDNTHQQDVIIEITGKVTASDGSTIYLFDRQGTHDGTCVS